MKLDFVAKLKKGQFIIHSRYGLCIVDKQQHDFTGGWFGIIIKPVGIDGIVLLARDSGVRFNTLLEHKNRCIKCLVEEPVIPPFIIDVMNFNPESGEMEKAFEAHKWIEPGDITVTENEMKFNSEKIESFQDATRAVEFIKNYKS